MGCSCKGNKKTEKPVKIVNNKDVVEIVSYQPTYSKQGVDRAMNFMNSDRMSTSERDWTYEFYATHFGEQINGYCDVVCVERIKSRLNKLYERLELYESE